MIRRRPIITRARGMTLLELLLAVAILASLSALTASLWGQVSSWSRGDASLAETMRVQRVIELLRQQWGDRRRLVVAGAAGGARYGSVEEGVEIARDRIAFLTATPLLFPDWGLVHCAYVIEPDLSSPPGPESRFDLVYEESRIVRFDLVIRGGVDRDGRPITRRTTLLKGCRNLRFERFGKDARFEVQSSDISEASAAPTVESSDDKASFDDDPALRSAIDELTRGPGVGSGATVAARELSRRAWFEAESRAANAGSDETEQEQRTPKWRRIDRDFDKFIPAVRLIGLAPGAGDRGEPAEAEEFACVLVVRALR